MDNFHKALEVQREKYRERTKEAIKREEIHQKREAILFIIAVISILLLLIVCCSIQYDKALNNCIKKGIAKNVCIANL